MDKTNKMNNKTAASLKNLNDTIKSILDNENKALGNGDEDVLNNIYKDFSKIVRSDSISSSHDKTQTIMNYLNQSIFGTSDTKNKNNSILSRSNMEKFFTKEDNQAMTYFINSQNDYNSICDEIESICAYMPQLENAIDIIVDGVLLGDSNSEEIDMDISFKCDTNDSASYVEIIKATANSHDLPNKLQNHILPKLIKFGMYYVMVIPYSEIGVKIMNSKIVNTKKLMENTDSSYSSLMTNLISLTESTNLSTIEQKINTKKIKSFSEKELSGIITEDNLDIFNTIKYNLDNIYINEEKSIPTTIGMTNLTGLSDDVKKEIENTIKKSHENEPLNPSQQGVIDPSKLENITGCYIELVDPRQMFPLIIFNKYVLGYYYLENYTYTRSNTNLTELLSNQMNFTDRNMVIDNIIKAILSNLKYGDLLQGNDNFKSMILNCLLHEEKINNPMKIKFVPAEYVVKFSINEDAMGNGQPLLTRSLYYGRLYTSLILFFHSSIIEKTTDTEFYYLNQSSISDSDNNNISDAIEQIRSTNFDLSSILRGNPYEALRSLRKRFFLTKGMNDIRPIDLETISGQQIDIPMDFLEGLKKTCINSTDVPSLITEDEDTEHVTKLNMTNTKFLRRSNTLKSNINLPMGELYIKVQRASNPNKIPEEILSTCQIRLRKSKIIDNNFSYEALNNADSTVTRMVEIEVGGTDADTDELNPYYKEELAKEMIKRTTPALPWGELEKCKKECELRAIEKLNFVKMQNDKKDGSSEE